jgi:ketosteroid isomerase-like protein
MDRSPDVRADYLAFCDRLSAGDVASFDDLVADDAKLIIGTAPGEWIDDRARMRFGFEAEGLRLEPGEPQAYEEGTMGWVVDEPTFVFPDGSEVPIRLTAVMRRDAGRWKIVHGHFSVGVPDEEVVALVTAWGKASP